MLLVPKKIRLAEGFTPNRGRVEVYYGSVWGTICNDGWTREDSDVVCKQLGYSRSGSINTPAAYRKGSGHIWMSNVRCTGNETYLHDCPFDGWGETSCRHSEDVSVNCEGLTEGGGDVYSLQMTLTCQGCFCLENPPVVRLAGSGKRNQGRVQIFYANIWGSVCDSNWDIYDAHVVCRQLGFVRALAARTGTSYGSDTSLVWMDNVRCTGAKRRLQDCEFPGWGVKGSYCSSTRKAGVVCSLSGGN